MSNEDLSELIGSLTQAVERVRITVQLRRLAHKKHSGLSFGQGGLNTSGMTREAMRTALQELKLHTARAAVAGRSGSENGPGSEIGSQP